MTRRALRPRDSSALVAPVSRPVTPTARMGRRTVCPTTPAPRPLQPQYQPARHLHQCGRPKPTARVRRRTVRPATSAPSPRSPPRRRRCTTAPLAPGAAPTPANATAALPAPRRQPPLPGSTRRTRNGPQRNSLTTPAPRRHPTLPSLQALPPSAAAPCGPYGTCTPRAADAASLPGPSSAPVPPYRTRPRRSGNGLGWVYLLDASSSTSSICRLRLSSYRLTPVPPSATRVALHGVP